MKSSNWPWTVSSLRLLVTTLSIWASHSHRQTRSRVEQTFGSYFFYFFLLSLFPLQNAPASSLCCTSHSVIIHVWIVWLPGRLAGKQLAPCRGQSALIQTYIVIHIYVKTYVDKNHWFRRCSAGAGDCPACSSLMIPRWAVAEPSSSWGRCTFCRAAMQNYSRPPGLKNKTKKNKPHRRCFFFYLLLLFFIFCPSATLKRKTRDGRVLCSWQPYRAAPAGPAAHCGSCWRGKRSFSVWLCSRKKKRRNTKCTTFKETFHFATFFFLFLATFHSAGTALLFTPLPVPYTHIQLQSF